MLQHRPTYSPNSCLVMLYKHEELINIININTSAYILASVGSGYCPVYPCIVFRDLHGFVLQSDRIYNKNDVLYIKSGVYYLGLFC